MRCLITGVNGFIGRNVASELLSNGYEVIGAGRDAENKNNLDHYSVMGSIDADTDWAPVLENVNAVVHLAARAHVVRDKAKEPLEEFRQVNVEGTMRLARQAEQAGVRRFLFISSIGVHGNTSREPFRFDDMVSPLEAYAISKWEAEKQLFEFGKKNMMEIVVIRPPLVYGAQAPGNFRRLLSALRKNVPLPFGAVYNQRTLVSIGNLVSLIRRCIEHPAAANQTFLAGDREDISTTQLLRRLGDALGHPARLLPVPVKWLELAGAMAGKKGVIQKICGNLQVNIDNTCEILEWMPPYSLDESFRQMAEGLNDEARV
ncbi:SDR family oxidoreductase [Variovorax sp. EBFNA2]|uniref:UDP-glucose 4-epimerase family protein n=1 Tax=Variovorax sp. EBFNA2 TaxID=3342097 RepID=UPI0029BFAFDD|nr:SDR family oxidoreductase [Variovorax boronicumulans]WPG38814.1 SDR family oxidoreductase [Variovorax boronicumulans]